MNEESKLAMRLELLFGAVQMKDIGIIARRKQITQAIHHVGS